MLLLEPRAPFHPRRGRSLLTCPPKEPARCWFFTVYIGRDHPAGDELHARRDGVNLAAGRVAENLLRTESHDAQQTGILSKARMRSAGPVLTTTLSGLAGAIVYRTPETA